MSRPKYRWFAFSGVNAPVFYYKDEYIETAEATPLLPVALPPPTGDGKWVTGTGAVRGRGGDGHVILLHCCGVAQRPFCLLATSETRMSPWIGKQKPYSSYERCNCQRPSAVGMPTAHHRKYLHSNKQSLHWDRTTPTQQHVQHRPYAAPDTIRDTNKQTKTPQSKSSHIYESARITN